MGDVLKRLALTGVTIGGLGGLGGGGGAALKNGVDHVFLGR